jgi:hypothetical protein
MAFECHTWTSHQCRSLTSEAQRSSFRELQTRWVDATADVDDSDTGLWVLTAWGWVHVLQSAGVPFLPKCRALRWRNRTRAPLPVFRRDAVTGAMAVDLAQQDLDPDRSVTIEHHHIASGANGSTWLVMHKSAAGSATALQITDGSRCFLCPEPVGVDFGCEWRSTAATAPAEEPSRAPPCNESVALTEQLSQCVQLPSAPSDCCLLVRYSAAREPAAQAATRSPDMPPTPFGTASQRLRQFQASVWVRNAEYTWTVAGVMQAPRSLQDLRRGFDDGCFRAIEAKGSTSLDAEDIAKAVAALKVHFPPRPGASQSRDDARFADYLLSALLGGANGPYVPLWVGSG